MNEERPLRLFLAVCLSVDVTRTMAAAIEELRPVARERALRVGWVPGPNLHVTLKFLGWQHAPLVDRLSDEVRAAVAGRQPFSVTARGAGAFPSGGDPRILWIGIDDPGEHLTSLAADLDERTDRLGIKKEGRPFHPHVTIGRVKEGAGAGELLEPLASRSFGESLVGEVTLFESRVSSSGSAYRPVFRVPLLAAKDLPPEQESR